MTAEDCVEGLEGANCDQEELFGFPFPAACEKVYDCRPCDNDGFFDDMDDTSAGLLDDRSALCANVTTDVFDGAITAGNPIWGPWEGGDDHAEFYGVYAFETELTARPIRHRARHVAKKAEATLTRMRPMDSPSDARARTSWVGSCNLRRTKK